MRKNSLLSPNPIFLFMSFLLVFTCTRVSFQDCNWRVSHVLLLCPVSLWPDLPLWSESPQLPANARLGIPLGCRWAAQRHAWHAGIPGRPPGRTLFPRFFLDTRPLGAALEVPRGREEEPRSLAAGELRSSPGLPLSGSE